MSSEILRFAPEMERMILDGWKSCTTRHRQHGDVGDKFTISGFPYRITEIYETDLSDVSELFYQAEGFNEPQEFSQYWSRVYKTPYCPNETVFVHFFQAVIGYDY